MISNSFGFNKDIENELGRRRTVTQRTLNEHRRELAEKYPELEKIRQESMDIALEYSEKIIQSPKDAEALGQLARELTASKKAELRRGLIENGLPEDFLENVPFCPVCRDRGMVDHQLCGCMRKFMIEKNYSNSGLIKGETFENFRHDLIEDRREARALDRIYSYCLEYAESFPDNELPDMLLIGEPGVGKTYLLNAIGERVLRKGYSVLRVTANRFIREVLDSINERGPAPDLIMPELLILDDLGTEPLMNNITSENLLAVIAERQDGNRPTLFATNKSLETISDEYGSRIYSRLVTPQRVKVIKMTTPCIRLIKT